MSTCGNPIRLPDARQKVENRKVPRWVTRQSKITVGRLVYPHHTNQRALIEDKKVKIEINLTPHEINMLHEYMDALAGNDEGYFKSMFDNHAGWFMGLLIAAYRAERDNDLNAMRIKDRFLSRFIQEAIEENDNEVAKLAEKFHAELPGTLRQPFNEIMLCAGIKIKEIGVAM